MEAWNRHRQAEKTLFKPLGSANLSAKTAIGRASYLCLVWLLTITIVPFVISQFFTSIYSYRYAIAASIPFYLLVARGVSTIRIAPIKLAVIGVVSILAFSAIYHVAVPQIQGTYVSIGVPKAHIREAANYIDKNARNGDLVIFSPWWERYFFYHYTTRNLAILGLPVYGTESNSAALIRLSNATHDHDRVWFVGDNSPKFIELRMLAIENLTKSYNISYNESYDDGYRGGQLYLFER